METRVLFIKKFVGITQDKPEHPVKVPLNPLVLTRVPASNKFAGMLVRSAQPEKVFIKPDVDTAVLVENNPLGTAPDNFVQPLKVAKNPSDDTSVLFANNPEGIAEVIPLHA